MKIFRKIAKFFLELSADFISQLLKLHFPKGEEFYWRTKLEIIFQRYERETTELCKRIIKPGMSVVDIGANMGYYSILFSRLVGKNGKVFAFEPEPQNFKILKSNVKKYKNIEVISKAVSDKSGILDFYLNKKEASQHSLLPSSFSEKIQVEAIDLDSFVSKPGFPSVDLIKIDVEGAEPFVISGAKKTLKANPDIKLIVEFSPERLIKAIEPIKFLNELKDIGFSVYVIGKGGQLEFLAANDVSKIENIIKQTGSNYINLFCQRED